MLEFIINVDFIVFEFNFHIIFLDIYIIYDIKSVILLKFDIIDTNDQNKLNFIFFNKD
jgi:hypothetical protein